MKNLEWLIAPISLSCPCGKSLQIAKDENGKWVLADFNKPCSPLITHEDANKVLEKFAELRKAFK